MKSGEERYRIAVDFDGVLHSYVSPWISAEVIPDPPVPGAIEWLRTISRKLDVVIFTTRGKTAEGRAAIRSWLVANGWTEGASVKVTAEKIAALVYLDDRAMRFDGVNFPTVEQVHLARPWNKP